MDRISSKPFHSFRKFPVISLSRQANQPQPVRYQRAEEQNDVPPHCSAHGLRKAGATFAAENGATDSQLKAIYGWKSAKMAAHYTRKAQQKKLAGAAMALIAPSRE